jgi:hypothetical protein
MLRGPLQTMAASAANQWAGRTLVPSGATTVTVSTSIIGSADLVLTSFQSNVASNVAQVIRVSSLAAGAFFGLQVSPAPVGTDFTITWIVVRA